jgi:tetratricopeptide (TPR) repeat protein
LYATRLFVALYSGQYDLAIEDAVQLESLGYGTPWVLSSRGLAHLERAELQQGMAQIDRALAIDPDDGFAHDRRGYALFLVQDYAQAEQELETALDRLPFLDDEQRAELHYHRALLFRAQERPGLALAEINEAAGLVRLPGVRRQIESVRDSLQ